MKKKNLIWLIGIGLLSTIPYFLIVSIAKAEYAEVDETTKTLAEDIYDFSMILKQSFGSSDCRSSSQTTRNDPGEETS